MAATRASQTYTCATQIEAVAEAARTEGARSEVRPEIRAAADGNRVTKKRPVSALKQRKTPVRIATGLDELTADIVECRACPRLVQWREAVAVEKRASFRNDHYWGRPVPGFGDPNAQVLILGLAPAAHGANRTGRVFTGDRSGDWLFRAMHRAGFANQPSSVGLNDGLALDNAYVAAAVRCAPPDNAPLPEERDQCLPFLQRELALLTEVRVIVVLGQFAYDVMCRQLRIRPKPKFGHGVAVPIPPLGATTATTMLCSFHPSQQNTFTGRLTEQMLDEVFVAAREKCTPL